MEIICDKNLCTGCGTCNDVCPKSAIAMKLDGEGFLYPVIDQSLCIDCKLCTKTCPINHPECVRANELCDVDVHEGWALNEDIRKKSSSGGIFGQLAFDLLNTEEWKVAGVAFNGKRAFHKLISKTDDLEVLQNTKYVQSDTSAIYHDVLIELSHGMNILFSGTPCQVAGCYSFLKGKSYSGKLLTIEVVCHGVPSYLVLDKSIEYNNAKKVISFRNKSQGWGYCSQQITYGTKCSELPTPPHTTRKRSILSIFLLQKGTPQKLLPMSFCKISTRSRYNNRRQLGNDKSFKRRAMERAFSCDCQ